MVISEIGIVNSVDGIYCFWIKLINDQSGERRGISHVSGIIHSMWFYMASGTCAAVVDPNKPSQCK